MAFDPGNAADALRLIPTLPGVFALRGEHVSSEPYLTRAADLRRRITRLLNPPELTADGVQPSKRLNLRERVRSIEYTVTGSEFESLLILYEAASAIFGHVEARRRLRMNTPFFLRLTLDHAHPRVYSTNRLSQRSLTRTYGPFPSRTAADRYCDAVLDLFKLRRCYEDLEVSPQHPGCAYGEMKKCMAPCNMSCTAEEYAAEAHVVESFFNSHGASMLEQIRADRERASAEMEFEQAAALHERYAKVKSAAALADELVVPVASLRAILVQKAATQTAEREVQEASVFLLQGGRLFGPERLSTLGVRAVKEQTSVGSSLFAQPLMIQAVPLVAENGGSPMDSPEVRAEGVLERLSLRSQDPQAAEAGVFAPGNAGEGAQRPGRGDLTGVSDHLSLLRRWYYRPEKQRAGEIFFPNADGSWPVRRILRGAARMSLGEPKPMAETQRDAAADAKVRILHEGREGIERVVPLVKKRSARKGSEGNA